MQPETVAPAKESRKKGVGRLKTPPTPRRRLLADRLARWSVTGGGLGIIASILGILVFILIEVAPLFGSAALTPELGLATHPQGAIVAATDEYRAKVATLGRDGVLRLLDRAHGGVELEHPLLAEDDRPAFVDFSNGDGVLAAATDDGRLIAVELPWEVEFIEATRSVGLGEIAPVTFDFDTAGGPRSFAVRMDGDAAGAAVLTAEGELVFLRREAEENLFTGEVTESWDRRTLSAPAGITALVLNADLAHLFAGLANGGLAWWRLDSADAEPTLLDGSGAVTALSLLLGDQSLVVGREDGSLQIWFPVRQQDESFRLTQIREFTTQSAPITAIAPSKRNKGFFALDAARELALYYSTSARVLWTGVSPADVTSLDYAPKADGLLLASGSGVESFRVRNPHPETGFKALFGKIWYEGYEEPAYVWQSTGGSDEFEPKLSLTPLMIGTLKGTLYSLILAIPLGVLGAMYTSHFMHPRLKQTIKPTVEIMAALPSVVLGFLAGLWLAPRIEQILPALMLMAVVVPALVVATGLAWRAMPLSFRGRFVTGFEVFPYMVVVAAGMLLCLSLNGVLENSLFGGSVPNWLMETTGLRYDQRNAVVVGLAMGFAVIPIIFSIAEDAFSNVPRNLVSGSLALGANRWQTVTRVVLPTASPGIFSAIMIGFGRAVGETMIVLMATGNTPVMDWNPFNGFRTLSANIAVEIPEAPQGDTLYRTLFLAALILFAFTFLINTVAELIRLRLRKRYAEL